MHGGDRRLGPQDLGIVVHQGQSAEALLEPLGNRHLGNHTPKDQLPGRIEKPVRQGVDNVIPSSGLGLVERLWRLRTAPAGQHRHNREVGVGASRHDAGEPITLSQTRKPGRGLKQRCQMTCLLARLAATEGHLTFPKWPAEGPAIRPQKRKT